MSVLINSAKVVLLVLCGAGFYATWYLLMNNGTADHMAKIRDVGPRHLPGTEEPLKTTYVGIETVDYQLTVLDLFFWELVDGSRPDASLFCYHFAGQVFSGWALLMIESMRKGNLWRSISFIAIWGVALQNFAYAVIIPIYLVAHLSTSPTIDSLSAGDYAVDVFDTLSVPLAMSLGYALPTVLMSLPAPKILDHSTKQNLMAAWQFFPVWVSLLQPVIAFVMRSFSSSKGSGGNSKPAPNASMKALRFVYIFLIVAAGASQFSTMSIIAISEWFPAMFASEYVGVMSLSKVFLPQAITPSTKMSSIGEGAHMLVQCDECIGSLSIALWSIVLLVQGYQNQRKSPDYVSLALYGVVAMALTGPLGFAVACIWARDELVQEGDQKKIQ